MDGPCAGPGETPSALEIVVSVSLGGRVIQRPIGSVSASAPRRPQLPEGTAGRLRHRSSALHPWRRARGVRVGIIGAALAGVARGVAVVRVHDVDATRDALKVWQAIQVAGDLS